MCVLSRVGFPLITYSAAYIALFLTYRTIARPHPEAGLPLVCVMYPYTLQFLKDCLAQKGILLRCLSAAKIESPTGLASTAEPSKVK